MTDWIYRCLIVPDAPVDGDPAADNTTDAQTSVIERSINKDWGAF